jgi:AcrR family transcriptional regulator
MSPRSEVAEKRTAQIIEAAIAVFAEKGFDGATMEDIADVVGINKATVYLYFDSKDALIQAIAETIFAQEVADLRAIVDAPGSAAERLAAYYQALIADEAQVLPLMPILYEFYALGLRRADVRAVISSFIKQITHLLSTIILDGIAGGEIAPFDVRKAARAFDALMSGTILHWVYAPDETEINEQLRYGVNLVLEGLELKHPQQSQG